MKSSGYYFTQTARIHYEKILYDTARQWGKIQFRKYRAQLRDRFQDIALHHHQFPARKNIVGETGFLLHQIQHHYIVFKLYDGKAIIVAILHEAMDIPARLPMLQSMTRAEITAIQTLIAKEKP